MEQYNGLSRAQLSFEYLHTNSTTHEFLFGAIAELIDNSRDAGATELDIYTIIDETLRGGYMLCFLDNGCGMSAEETRSVIIFGKSVKKSEESTAIGMYGNGLKSGSMRIGNDMILFTKKNGVLSCLMLSRSFHEEEKIDEVIVPLPSFDVNSKQGIYTDAADKKRHEMEIALILKYSPFKCMRDLFSQFDKMKGDSGCLVIIYNMKLLDNGQAELDVFSDSKDIILSHPELGDNVGVDVDVELCPERTNLRAYIAVLYSDPRMKVYLQGRKVQTKRLVSCLYKPRSYHYASKTFKTRAEHEVAKAKEEVKISEMKAKEAESKAKDYELRHGDSTDAESLKNLRMIKNKALDCRELVKQKQNAYNRKLRALKEPKTLTFYFGINLENRACDGMFVFNCSRLIKMYQRIGPQQDSGLTCRGVVGIVNVPYLVLEPTHNKQDFADAKEFRFLMRAMADHLMQYWDDIGLSDSKSVDILWTKFGYQSAKWRDPPSNDEKFVKRRALSINISVQCDQCLKWRVLPFQQSLIGKDVPDNWQCKDNPDPKHKKCSEPEQQLNIALDTLKRKIKTKEQRQAELEEQIRRKQEELEKISGGNKSKNKSRFVKSESSEEEEEEEDAEEQEDEEEEDNEEEQDTKPRLSKRSVKPVARLGGDKIEKKSVVSTSDIKKRPSSGLTPNIALQNRNLKAHQVTTPSSLKRPSTSTIVGSANKQSKPNVSSGESLALFASNKPLPSNKIEHKQQSSGAVRQLPSRSAKETSSTNAVINGGSVSTPNHEAAVQKPVAVSTTKPPVKSEPTEDEITQDSSDDITKVQVRHKDKWTDATIVKLVDDKWHVKLVSNTDSQVLVFDVGSNDIKRAIPSGLLGTDKLTDNLKVCLRYFLPPDWPVDKDAIHSLSNKELTEFPLEKFFDKYEQGLRKLFTKFQNETTVANEKLNSLRSNVRTVLVKSLNKDLSSITEDDQIDDYVKSLANQSGSI